MNCNPWVGKHTVPQDQGNQEKILILRWVKPMLIQ